MSVTTPPVQAPSVSGPVGVVVDVQVQPPTPPPHTWHDHWIFAQADWPSLLLNLVVLALAIYGVKQAHDANETAKRNERRIFKTALFKPHGDSLARWRGQLQSIIELCNGLVAGRITDKDFAAEVDSFGSMLFEPLLNLGRELRTIDATDEFGRGWEKAFQPHRDRIEAQYDIANEPTESRAARVTAIAQVAKSLQDGLHTTIEFEFEQSQSWGAPDAQGPRYTQRTSQSAAP